MISETDLRSGCLRVVEGNFEGFISLAIREGVNYSTSHMINYVFFFFRNKDVKQGLKLIFLGTCALPI